MVTLGLFAKYWQPGQVKTRLARTLGEERAAALHRVFLSTLVKRLEAVADQRVLLFSPPTAEVPFRTLAPEHWQTEPQGEGDLGARMQRFFARYTGQSSRAAMALGADSPNLPGHLIDEAIGELAEPGVVLGPSNDGGYYLLGIRGPLPPIFDDMPWGTASVWPETICRLEQAGVRSSILPDWYDIDQQDDLDQLLDDLRHQPLLEAELVLLMDTIEECNRRSAGGVA